MRWYKCEGFTTYGIEYSKEGSVEKVQYSIDGVIAGFYTRNPERKEELLDDKMLKFQYPLHDPEYIVPF